MSPCSCENRRTGRVRGRRLQVRAQITAHSRKKQVLLCWYRLELYMSANVPKKCREAASASASASLSYLKEVKLVHELTCPPCLQRQSAQLPDGRASSQELLSDWATTASLCHYGGPGGWWRCGGFGTSRPAGQSWCRSLPPPFPQRRRDTVENL